MFGPMQGDSADDLLKWVTKEVGPDALKDPDVAKQVTLAVLRHAIPNPKVIVVKAVLVPNL